MFVELFFYCVAYREVRVHVNYPLANGKGVGWVQGVGGSEGLVWNGIGRAVFEREDVVLIGGKGVLGDCVGGDWDGVGFEEGGLVRGNACNGG